ncbi:ParB/RepB/Spo0J family partition protein [Streptomyces drozdowiczii]|uniref:ParB/RepB/Spo0J family partition protein n=1 Tax=Streptomyces drozdowiczii TaxID=202862 RepID=UPI0022480DB3|nr:ParB/RepB/Spo0J family partition protein [Streptomyces drozdowiczii]MCX0241864.1 ParB/RepB/Spo0J family partition protein [Streptomyces drozdowiczii]
MRKTKAKDQERVTRGFTLDEDGQGGTAGAPRRVRTRQQIMNGEGKRPPASVPLAELAHNPFNPRDEYTDIEETAESLRARGQIQPVTVARRAAFLRAHPDQEELVGAAEYVVIDGNRRLKAAAAAGLDELRIDVHDGLAVTAADILESALIANVHRVDVPPLDQAKAIQQLVDVHGSQGKVAKRLGKTPAWVSQRLALLQLTPDLQNAVETGELKVEPARRIGRLPQEQQAPAAQEVLAVSKTPRQRAPRRQLGDGGEAPTVNGVNGSGVSGSGAATPQQTVNAVNTSAVTAPAAQASVVIPDASPESIVAALKEQLSPQDLTKVAELLMESLTESATG